MALTQKTEVDAIDVERNGVLLVRLALLIMDGDVIRSKNNHRMSIAPGENLGERIAMENANLAKMGEAPLPTSEVARIQRIMNLEHTSQAIAAYQELLARQQALNTEEGAEPE